MNNLIDLEAIVTNASFFWERLDPAKFLAETSPDSEQKIQSRLDRWCSMIAKGNRNILKKRIEWDGLDFDQVCLLLGDIRPAENMPLPKWAHTLQEIITTAAAFTPPTDFLIPVNIEKPLPFEDLVLPSIQVARQRLCKRLGCQDVNSLLATSILTSEAYGILERSLLQRLTELSTKTFDTEFSLVRPFGQNLLQLLQVESEKSKSKAHYVKFTTQLLQDGLLAFFSKYPVLARLTTTAIEFWVESMAEFCERLQHDQPEIQNIFAPQQKPLGKVVDISADLSDPHDRGQTVMILTFESEVKVVYKPKDLGIEVAFNQFLAWCNQKSHQAQDSLLDFKVTQVLNRDTYGWVEFIEQKPCLDADAAIRFYQRAGMLLGVLYVLYGTDCHCENLIAYGEHLVLIDAEALLFPEAHPFGAAYEQESTAAQQLYSSVLMSGLLPCWDFSGDKKVAYDISGLGSTDIHETPSRIKRWQDINTDDMHLGHESIMMKLDKNVAILDGVVLSANDYQQQIVQGFEKIYKFLREHKSDLLTSDGPLTLMSQHKIRFIFRPTRVYGIILDNSWAPANFKNGADFSIAIDQLSYAFLVSNEKPNAWPILNAELRSLEQLDIPLFTVQADSDTLLLPSEQSVPQCFKKPGYEQACTRLQMLSDQDLSWQVAIIQAAFHAKIAQSVNPKKEEKQPESLMTFSNEQLLVEVRAIAAEIESRAIPEPNGGINWIGLGLVDEAERYQLQVLGESLYEGRCGIAVFFAALYQVTGEKHYCDLALSTLYALRQQIQIEAANKNTDSLVSFLRMPIGGAAGLGSMIYSLVKVSQFLNDKDLLSDAEALVNLITPARISADKDLDVIQGGAGAILSLVTFYEATGNPNALTTAIACGQHLLSCQTSVDGAPGAWVIMGEKPLSGFSHGVAGIAYALLRLYAITSDQAFLNGALEGIEYERTTFSADKENWMDLRQLDSPTFLTQWCHGAAGIGLGRLGGLSILDKPDIRKEIEIAVKTTQNHGLQNVDHLCCGNWGRVETLLVAASENNSSDLQQVARQTAANIIARAKHEGGYRLFHNLPNSVFNPSFFQGTSGIGYQMLRLIDGKLPAVLLWQ
jgi:type 2 lantibiotic biosynthesis protein LanM